MRCWGLCSIHFRARQPGQAFGSGAWSRTAGPALMRGADPTLPFLKLKDDTWKLLDSRRPPPPSPSGNLTLVQFCTPAQIPPSTTPWNRQPSPGFPERGDALHFWILHPGGTLMSPVSLRQRKKPISFQMGSKSLRKKKNLLNFVFSFGLQVRWIWVLILSKWEICLVL